MPTTRRSTGGRNAAATGKQSTLSFGNRVTKNVTKSAKDSVISSSLSKPNLPTTKDLPTRAPKKTEEAAPEPVEIEPEQVEVEEEVTPEPEKTEAEVRAEKITAAQVNRYWRKLEAERIAKRVHQGDLDVGEKVLRYFDVSSQYGPCIGISRQRRWERAERLGLSPPIEVLAVLLKAEADDEQESSVQRAHMDEIMNATIASTD